MGIMARLKQYLQTEMGFTDFQIQQIKFVALTLLSEISKLFLLFILFAGMSKLPELAASVFTLTSVRIFTGGIHLKHYCSCMLMSFCFFAVSVCILPACIHLSVRSMLILLCLCLPTVYLIGPVPSAYRPALTEGQKKRSRLKACSSISIYIFLIFIFHENRYLSVSFWTILTQTLQLGLAKVNLRRKEGASNENHIQTRRHNL